MENFNREELFQQMQHLHFLVQSVRFFNILMDTVFLFANLFLIKFVIVTIITQPVPLPTEPNFNLYTSFMFLPVLGIVFSVLWAGTTQRFQMFLKLRYFQIRTIERILGKSCLPIFGEESEYFARPAKEIKSIDGEEVLLNNFSGAAGRLKTFPWAWIFPGIFFIFYLYILVTLCIYSVY